VEYRFQKLVRMSRELIVIRGLKIHILAIPRDIGLENSLRDELMRDSPYDSH
jgi:hypothetical protein